MFNYFDGGNPWQIDYYKKMKSDAKANYRYNIEYNTRFKALSSRIRYNGLKIHEAERLAHGLIKCGGMALFIEGGELVIAPFALIGGGHYSDGVFKNLKVFYFKNEGGGYEREFKDWRNNPDVVIHWYNNAHTPDMLIPYYADRLAEVEKSEEVLVEYARAHDFIVAEDEEQAKAIRRGFDDIKDGRPYTVAGNALRSAEAKTLGIGGVERSKWLSDLAIYHNTLSREWYFLEGCDIGNSIKKAQQTDDETNRADQASRIITEDALFYATAFCDEFNEKLAADYGNTISCELAPSWATIAAKTEDAGDDMSDDRQDENEESEGASGDNSGTIEED